MATALTDKDFRAAYEFVRSCELASDLESYRSTVLRISEHVPATITSYNEVDLTHAKAFARIDPPGLIDEAATRVFERHAHQHPVICHMDATGDPAPRSISDFLAAEEFHSLDLYRLFFGELGVEDQIAFGLPAPRELVLGVAINRAERGFSQRERTLLALLAPYVGRAYAVARARSRVRGAMAAADLELSPDSALVVLDRADRAAALSPGAEALLQAYLGAGLGPAGALPQPLGDHLSRARDRSAPGPSPSELLLERGATRLRVCFVEGAEDGEPDALVLDSEPDPLAEGRLRRRGLSARESELVRLLADGLTNAELAAELGISPSTVKRHLESIYDKLGVRTRAGVVGTLLRG